MFIFLMFLFTSSCVTTQAMSTLQGKTFVSPRSQSVNADRELVGWYRFINLYDQCNVYGAASATPEAGQSFRPERIAQYFFGTDQLIISGSQVPNRQPNQILADYFGLSPLFQSTVCIEPRITTFLVDFNGYLGYRSWYIRAHAPVVWVKNTLRLNETVIYSGMSTPYPPLYMATDSITAPSESWAKSMAGGITYGEVSQGIEQSRIVCSNHAAGLSEIQMALGYNFINRPNGHAGFNFRVYAPTGTRPNSEILFQAIVGNGHHVEVGAGFTGHILLWEKECDRQFAFYTDINLTHLCKTRQRRSFDLCSAGFMSRYMLVKQFDLTGTYIQNTIPLVNVTSFECEVSSAVQMDLAVMFAYTHSRWSFDIGYDAWARTREEIKLCQQFPFNEWALKGIQNVSTGIGPSDATQSTATIFGNPFADQAAVADPNPPVFIAPADINIRSAASSFAFTNKIFWHLSYIFEKCGTTEPFLGTGGEVEFEGLNPRNRADNNHNSISQWGLWVKGGIGF